MDRLTAERIAENDARFREANERIREVAVEHGIETVPFICECADPECVAIVRLRLDDEQVRSNPRWFVNVAGHDRAAGSAARVAATYDGWIVAEKVGHAGRVVEELDERGAVGAEGER